MPPLRLSARLTKQIGCFRSDVDFDVTAHLGKGSQQIYSLVLLGLLLITPQNLILEIGQKGRLGLE